MKYLDIQNSLIELKPIFTAKDIELAGFSVYPYMLSQWVDKGYIKRLGGGKYLFSKSNVLPEYIANHVREPSYISLESALYYYNLTIDIPFHIISVTSKGTKKSTIEDKVFFYRHVKPEVFTGYIMKQIGANTEIGKRFYIATPEKALVDLFYLSPNKYKNFSDFKEARFHEEDMKKQIDWRGVYNLSLIYKNKSLEKRLTDFKEYIFSQ